jgi:hypothetical protein
MEEQKEPEEGSNELKQDPLVEKLVVDPTRPPDVQILAGFLGRSSEAGNWRLYTPQLDSYVEFSAGDVLHTQPLAAAHSPMGGTIVWLRRDATLKHARIRTRQAQAEFVQGDITSRFMAGTGTQEGHRGEGPPPIVPDLITRDGLFRCSVLIPCLAAEQGAVD